MFDFEKSSVNNYVKLDGPSQDLHEISFCSWIQTNDHFNYGSLISYATQEIDNAFTFTDYNGFVLYINGENVITDIKIIDNVWHFLCGKKVDFFMEILLIILIPKSVSWTANEGQYEIYLDGALNVQGFNLSRSTPIKGQGIFIIGQEQDSLGGLTFVLALKIDFHAFPSFQVVSVNLNHSSAKFPSWTFGTVN